MEGTWGEEHARAGTDWRMRASRLCNRSHKDMEYNKYRGGNRAKEAEAIPPKKRTENSITTGICATPVGLTYPSGTQVKPAHKSVAEQATRRVVIGGTTRATCKQDTPSDSRRKMRIFYPPILDHTKLDS